MGDTIDYTAGIVIEKKTGDRVCKGDLLATLYSQSPDALTEGEEKYLRAIRFSDAPPARRSIILDRFD